jgi:hypothetical protein
MEVFIMHRHIQFAPDGVTVEGLSELSSILKHFPETDDNKHVTLGWRYIDGEWLPPLEPPEEDKLYDELSNIEGQLRQLYESEQFAAWQGEPVPDNKESKAGLSTKKRDIRAKLDKLGKK